MFGREVKYIWRKPWSLMSCLYVVVRYLGIVLAITNALWGSTIDTPELVRCAFSLWFSCLRANHRCIDTFKFMNWGGYVYTLALEVTMMLRTLAMYNQSRKLLWFILVLFIPVVVVEFILSVFYFGAGNGMHVTDIALPGTEFCASNFSLSPFLYISLSLPGIVFDGILAIFAIARVIPLMQRPLGGCRTNVCMQVLARDNVFYFLGNLAYRSFNLIPLTKLPPVYQNIGQVFCSVEPFVVPPYLVISFRESFADLAAGSEAGSQLDTMEFQPGSDRTGDSGCGDWDTHTFYTISSVHHSCAEIAATTFASKSNTSSFV
ncbi:hypothetical protein PAXRUDRAFT_752498 [Paxillus rubicundulus Ve08.2h10]|uniref:DUF6533 domain-containing protein n=1 Tax=Paxillus rubicundulus Ve08.2h10 TaxID=930991 RepID=A0A0D0D0M5_9AGAM|nr:hypothetical protein PAXRUDRAFT_752498 [Paxillus rubicundulus Ve08.2h10]